jgi:hypothetical protein
MSSFRIAVTLVRDVPARFAAADERVLSPGECALPSEIGVRLARLRREDDRTRQSLISNLRYSIGTAGAATLIFGGWAEIPVPIRILAASPGRGACSERVGCAG